MNSIPTDGYLPAGEITKYRVIDFSNSKNITLVMTKTYGNPVLYGYICENFRLQKCFFDEKTLADNRKFINLIFIF